MAGGGGRTVAFPLTLIAIGIIFLLHNFGYLHGNLLKYWPILLIVWGLGMIWAARRG